MTDDIFDHIQHAVRTATLVKKVTIGTGYWDPAYPYHGAIRLCPFCGETYRRHGGHADHRDRCEQGPNPGANPIGVTQDD